MLVEGLGGRLARMPPGFMKAITALPLAASVVANSCESASTSPKALSPAGVGSRVSCSAPMVAIGWLAIGSVRALALRTISVMAGSFAMVLASRMMGLVLMASSLFAALA